MLYLAAVRAAPVLVLAAWRSCRSSRPGCRPAAAPPGPVRSSSACTSTRRSIVAGDLRQRASGREARAPRSEQGASSRTRSKPGAMPGLGGVGLDHGDAAQAEPRRLGRDFRRPLRIALDRDHLAAVAHPRGDLAGLDAGAGAEVEDVLARLGVEHLDHRGRAPALRRQLPRRDQLRHQPPGLPLDHDHLRRRQRPLASGALYVVHSRIRRTGSALRRRRAGVEHGLAVGAQGVDAEGGLLAARCRRRAASGRPRGRARATTSAPARAAPSA